MDLLGLSAAAVAGAFVCKKISGLESSLPGILFDGFIRRRFVGCVYYIYILMYIYIYIYIFVLFCFFEFVYLLYSVYTYIFKY